MRILVLRGGALGDLILTLPILGEIRRGYPAAEVVLLGVYPQARLAAPEFVDRVERIDAPDLVPLFVDGLLPQAVKDRLGGFDLAISFLSDPGAIVARNLAAAGARQVVACPPSMRPDGHAVFHLADVLRQLGLTLRDPVARLSFGPKTGEFSRLGFHVGSGSSRKNWPVDKWIELTQQLNGCFEDFLLVGGEADENVVREFRARSRIRRLRTLLNPSLASLCQALNECTVFVGHDTGVTHLATAVGTPIVALFGPTNANVWAPLGEHVQLVCATDGKMESIAVQEVVAAVTAMGAAARNTPFRRAF